MTTTSTTPKAHTFAFNVTFTRPDENDAIEYTVGYNIYGDGIDTEVKAEARLREAHFAHLTVIKVELFAIMTEDGDILYSASGFQDSLGSLAKAEPKILRDIAKYLTPEAIAACRAMPSPTYAGMTPARAADQLQAVRDEALRLLEKVDEAEAAGQGFPDDDTDDVCEHGYAQGCRACNPDA